MELRDAVRQRRMVRSYDPARPVPRETVESLLNLAVRAPSAGHTQGWRFLVLDDPASCGRFWSVTTDKTDAEDPWLTRMQQAPVLVVFFSDRQAYLDRYAEPDKGWTDRDEAHWPVPYWDIDTGFTALLMLLAVVDEGLGALFFGIPPHQIGEFRTLYGVPGNYLPIGAVAIGHPDPAADKGGSAKVIKRRSLDDLVHRGRWGRR
jgi:nitroreductase